MRRPLSSGDSLAIGPGRSCFSSRTGAARPTSYPVGRLIPLGPPCYPVLERDRRDGAMTDFPRSLPEFERRFPDEAACAEWLLERRWGSGFACPGGGHDRFWRLGRKGPTPPIPARPAGTPGAGGAGGGPPHPPPGGGVS